MRVYIGCSGYFYWGWKGKFYPEDIKPSQWFKYYAKFFNSVEINSTFYRFPTKTSLKKWYKDSPDGFKLTVKVNREITHLHKMKDIGYRLKEFYEVAYEALQEKLGAILFQLPPSFKYTQENLERIITQLDPAFKNVIEFRHKSWWNEEVYEELKKHNIIFCSISGPALPEELIKTTSIGYVRFHGKDKWYNYNYSTDELNEWVDRIKKTNFEEVYIYFNNDSNAFAPFNAIEMRKLLETQ